MIEFSNVSKHFGTQDVLSGVSLRILAGERVGIVGPNGAGKSTLFGLITSDIAPDQGDVVLPRDVRIGHVRQQLRALEHPETLLDYTAEALPRLAVIHSEITDLETRLPQLAGTDREKALQRIGALQNEYEHLGGYEMRNRAEATLSGLGFRVEEFDRPFNTFSGGWQMRAELARTLIGNPNLLLLDEPSNYLDLPAVEWLQRFLREYQGTLLLISHDRFLLQSLTKTTVEVAGGLLTRYVGGFDDYLRERDARYEQQLAARKNQDRRREQIQRFVDRFRAKNTKASQVQSRIKMLEKMETVQVAPPVVATQAIRIPPPPHCGEEVVRLEQAGLHYDGQHWVLRGIDLSIHKGEKIALVGFNGTGKTTLLRMLAGRYVPSEGRRILGHKVIVGYQSQEFAETMDPHKTAIDIVKEAHPQCDGKSVRTILGGFGFGGDAVDKPCGVLSGGETIRLAFARIFVHPPNLLILDEPTTHLDMQGRRALEQALRDYEGTLCLVSHDKIFVRNVAKAIIAMTPPGITRFHGDYDYYCEKTAGAVFETPRATQPGQKSQDKKEAKRQRAERIQERSRRKRALRKAVRNAEASIEQLEAERETLMQTMTEGNNPDFASINRRLKEIQEQLKQHTHEWEGAALQLEELESS